MIRNQVINEGLQMTIRKSNIKNKIAILSYITNWEIKCNLLIDTFTEFINILHGHEENELWISMDGRTLTYSTVIGLCFDLDAKISNIYSTDWYFNNIFSIAMEDKWTLQNKCWTAYMGSWDVECSSETAKRNHFLKSMRQAKFLITHLYDYIHMGKNILNT
jgi:hypothetical protein